MAAFYEPFAPGAAVLAVMNVLLEVIFYWKSPFPRSYQIVAATIMSTLGI
ncbi:hypothetical protein [Paenibacillus agilis]|nr:hypothetical protein [Paenibacillus agilis]